MGCQVRLAYGQNIVHSWFFSCCVICRPVIAVVAAPQHVFLSCLVDVMYVRRRTLHQQQFPRPLGIRVALTCPSVKAGLYIFQRNLFWGGISAPRNIFL